MTKQIAVIEKPSAIRSMASRLNVEPEKLLSTLKNTVFKGASDDELLALTVVANEYKLNPFLRQVYAFPAKGGGIVPVVGVDGWVSIANSQPDYDGTEFEMVDDKDGNPFSCTATIYSKSRSRAVKVTEYFKECFRPTEPWKTMPRRMLRHKAFIQGVRVAFGVAGIYDEDEANDAASDEKRFKVAKPVFAEPATNFLQPPAAVEPETVVTHEVAESETQQPLPAKSETQKKTAREIMFAKMEEMAIGETRFENYLKKNNVIAASASLRSIADGKCAAIVDDFTRLANEYMDSLPEVNQ